MFFQDKIQDAPRPLGIVLRTRICHYLYLLQCTRRKGFEDLIRIPIRRYGLSVDHDIHALHPMHRYVTLKINVHRWHLLEDIKRVATSSGHRFTNVKDLLPVLIFDEGAFGCDIHDIGGCRLKRDQSNIDRVASSADDLLA